MKFFLYEIKNVATGETDVQIAIEKYNIWTEYLQNKSRKRSIEVVMLSPTLKENIQITVLEEKTRIRDIYYAKSSLNPISSHGHSQIISQDILEYMEQFGFMLNGKEKITKGELLSFCDYLKDAREKKTNWSAIKRTLTDSGNLVTKISGGQTYYVINKEVEKEV